ncbi:PREDICTED: pentatricopeptide repeat-containing protein At4g19220, mitochondrial-like isoform X2 [Lupinus angustifolius]|uniref:pentatricopeptide repeat-containing protein At4g19220, mitochondrial-like isoform X2 n=1 Tax=Lupinus angustifolius TaxID=3871 RepID=UPI00092FC66A|nr:PREDICTED: pentatricopeptide repeat-containing protein At4g19220, mitochondrial-like isoform X2 [Lupinus angustifolius]
MRTWLVFQFPLKSTSTHYSLHHIRRSAFQNLNLLQPRTSPSISHSFSSQNYQNWKFSIFRRHGVPILPYATPLLSCICHCFCTAIQMFVEMPQRTTHIEYIHFELVVYYIKSLLKQPRIVAATLGHCAALKIGALSHLPTSTSLLTVYSKAGYFNSSWTAMDLFEKMIKSQYGFDSTTLLLMVSASLVSVFSACANLELLNLGKSIHGLVIKSPLGSNTRVQNSIITMYDRCRDINSARVVFKFCSTPNLCSWNCMISALSHNKECREAFEHFCHLHFKPNEFTIVSVLSICTQIGVLRHGKQVHAQVFRSGFQDNSFISAALVDLYSNCGRLDTALQVFKHAEEKSESAWNSMIAAYGNHGNGEKAIKLFHEMIESGSRVTKSTFVSLLSACRHSGLIDQGLWYYDCMLDKYGVQPETEHQVYMVDMLGRSGRLDEAYEFTKGLQSNASSGVWGTLLSACNYHGDLKLGKQIAEHLFQVEPQNVGYYISLSNMYVAAGSWKDATDLRQFIQDKGLRKAAGYSLIDVC